MTNQLELVRNNVVQAKTAEGILGIEGLKNAWVEKYNLINKTTDGLVHYEIEQNYFLKAFQANPKLDKLDPFSKYAAWMDVCGSGLSLANEDGYILSMDNKTVVFFPSWHGRFEQIRKAPDVVFAYEPEVVYDCDIYIVTKNGPIKTVEHVEEGKAPRTKDSKIIAVYMYIEYAQGKLILHEMKALDVYNIRDRRSKPFIAYMKALENKKLNPDAKFGDKVNVQYKDRDGQWQTMLSDPPMPVTDEAQYFKKTLVRRTYRGIKKTASQQDYESRIEKHVENMAAEPISKLPEDMVEEVEEIKPVVTEEPEYTSYEEVGDDTVNTNTGEVQPTASSESESEDDIESY